MKKILINAPLMSQSGYGSMSRFALNVLREHQDKFDIYVNVLSWGQTGWMHEENDEYNFIRSLRVKTEQYTQASGGKPQFDVSLQITIPNEWKRMAPVNIGYTAGIETTHISPAWLEPSQAMDRIITISEFSKSVFLNTVFQDQAGNQHKVTTPIDVVHFPVRESSAKPLELELPASFNFLTVNQWGPRKNMELLISTFVDEFRNDDVGLVIKTNQANDSIMDRARVEEALEMLLRSKGDRKCRIHLIHGRLTQDEIDGLYRHPKIKAFATATHGEGFGMPIFEAVQAGLPVIATDWSGHLDFLSVDDKKMFAKVDYELKQIEPHHVWKGVMEANTGWAFPAAASLRNRMREVYKDHGRFKSWANKLAEHNKEKFSKQKVYEDFFYALGLFSRPKLIEPKPICGISFCIPTHGKRLEKTLLTIKSIQKQEWNSIPYEIIIAGDVDNFKDQQVVLVDKKEDAHSRKVASLRNTAAEKAKYENIVFCDDDVILDKEWLLKTLQFSQANGWEVLGNKLLNPDGTRHWDRGILSPRILVDYDHSPNDKNLMQTSGFFIIRKEVLQKVKWDESRLVYADRENKSIPEDVQFSLDLHNNNYELSFNKNAIVWHNDENYTEFSSQTLTKTILKNKFNIDFFLELDKNFLSLKEEI